jgi:hypothetical protein
MSQKDPNKLREQARERIAQVRDQIQALDLVCSGTLLKRMKTCGKETCRCAHDPDARHGPYYEWGFMERGALVHLSVSQEQAVALKAAIANHRLVRRLLHAWEAQTVKIINAETEAKR